MNEVNAAVKALQAGKLIAFPTETVYGLAADASNPKAVEQVFLTKGRPANHPVIVHIANADALSQWAQNIPPAAYTLAERFWPGPLTLILQKQPHVSAVITGGLDTIALRIPQHPLTQQLLQEFGGAIVGPSANKYGHVSPTTAQHVRDDLGDAVAVVLDGGECAIGIESTILDLSGTQPVIRRHGAITADQLVEILQQGIAIDIIRFNKSVN